MLLLACRSVSRGLPVLVTAVLAAIRVLIGLARRLLVAMFLMLRMPGIWSTLSTLSDSGRGNDERQSAENRFHEWSPKV